MNFIPSLIGVVALLVIGYLCGMSTLAVDPEQSSLLPGSNDQQYFCPREAVCQAVRVSDGYFPDWVLQTGAEVVIAPSPRVTIQQGNSFVRATAADYLLRMSDGTFFAIPVETFEALYQAINPA